MTESIDIWWLHIDRPQYHSKQITQTILARYIHRPPHEITLKTTQYGKPYLQDNPIHFNVSHTHCFYVISVSRHAPVGIDCEEITRRRLYHPIVKRVFSAHNQKTFNALSPPLQHPAFLRGWTKYESIIKYYGQSIFRSPITLPNLWTTAPTRLDNLMTYTLSVHPLLITSIAVPLTLTTHQLLVKKIDFYP